MQLKISKNNIGFTRTPTLALLLGIFNKIKCIHQSIIKLFSSQLFLRRNKNIMPKLVCGFTLVETLVAVSILSISTMAAFTAVQNGLQNSSIAKDQTTAFYLAQEAMEFIKNKRDENALYTIQGVPPAHNWLFGLSDKDTDPCWFGNICTIDVTMGNPNNIGHCEPGSDPGCSSVLNQQDGTYLFGYSSGSGWRPTIFKREIKFREIVSHREVEVTIHMMWTSRWGPKSFEISEILFNRQ